ncbi:glycine cleavage system H protein, mitochondrial [Trichomonascus vanleenenianus]|uniref:glycine decarboxylase subunit H n=1 Tax=Trichomonascus vanleenenianus TaxID=2268995 RepID=UPI003ECA14A9
MLATAFRSAARVAVPRVAVARAVARPTFLAGLRFASNAINKESIAFTYSPEGPKVKFSEDHEWVALHGDGTAFVGITKYAADALGEATYVEVPEPETEVEKGDSMGSVESVKSASELYAPVAGTIIEGNQELADNATLVNEDPMGAAWFGKIKVSDNAEFEELMDSEAYEAFLKEQD